MEGALKLFLFPKCQELKLLSLSVLAGLSGFTHFFGMQFFGAK